MDEEAQREAAASRVSTEASFSTYVKGIIWICAAAGSWAALIGFSRLARALIP